MSEKPDAVGNGVRFGCGFMLGAAIALTATLEYLQTDWLGVAAGTLVVGSLFGLAAMNWGEAFWEWFSENWWWW